MAAKRAHKDSWHAKPAKRSKGRGPAASGSFWDSGVPLSTYAFKTLVNDEVCASLLGSKGAIKMQIQEETGVKLVFSNRENYFPGTVFRVLGIYGDDCKAIVAAFDAIIQRIVQVGGSDHYAKENGEYIFRFLITEKMTSIFLGSNGTVVKQIRQETGAKVSIDKNVYLQQRMTEVVGTPEVITNAMNSINEWVQSDLQDPSYALYAGVLNFSDKDPNQLAEYLVDPSGKENGVNRKQPKVIPRRETVATSVVDNGSAVKNAAGAEGVPKLAADLAKFPPGTTQCDYSIDCLLNAGVVTYFETRGIEESSDPTSNYIEDVQAAAHISLNVDETVEQMEDGDELRRISVVGHLPNIYAAHAMLLAKSQSLLADWARLEAEAQAEDAQREAEINGNGAMEDADAIKARIAELKAQLDLAEATKAASERAS